MSITLPKELLKKSLKKPLGTPPKHLPTKLIINGAFGRMGKLACEAISNHPEFELIAKVGKKDNLSQIILNNQPDIVLDLTTAECVWRNSNIILDHNISPIIGTSGLNPDQIKQLCSRASALKLGGLIIPNFSIGAVLQMQYAAKMAKYFSAVEIIEMHHETKFDAPSGTAIATANKISEQLNQAPISQLHHPELTNPELNIITGSRGARQNNIPIHAIRLPGIVAKQQVLFGNNAETLTIEHNTNSREAFMPGIILACQKARQFDTILCGLETCLDIDQ